MENALYVGLSQQMVLERQMDMVANNIANLNTTAYRAQRPVFQEYVMEAGPRKPVSFVLDFGIARDTRAGVLTPTGNPFDIALNGEGFLSVQTPDGVRYTRNGHFTMDADGRLVTREGYALLDDGGAEITVNDTTLGTPVISADGTIAQGDTQIGRVGMVAFDNQQALRAVGDSLFEAGDGAAAQPAPETTRLVQGMLEGSNVQPVVEMTRMIELQRRYQTMQNLLTSDNELQRTAIQRLGKLSQA
ncbi:flagellar basal-body rod protein FlgF [Zavarzinia compransoris]|uniref:Flagellar basal-body rod protein FlgF n=1 Tax=Zavarzinia compransoris TaxID=1264899 RepID=A0A317E0Y9_9PROT|nr:flagellar basal-body rod protein FlgF [Zavarzinia compransoris]PWR19796.1 flagellar basal-body rod protein FlgF [Zavarzinia compransoris]TDP45099.1 flagellar basal-body rod protein FlgF [Zavarzinia compransoris]